MLIYIIGIDSHSIMRVLGFNLPRHVWTALNRARTNQGRSKGHHIYVTLQMVYDKLSLVFVWSQIKYHTTHH